MGGGAGAALKRLDCRTDVRVDNPYVGYILLRYMKNEEKRERFKRLGVQRTNAVLNKVKVLSNCANRSAYEYTEEEVNRIFSEIERRVREAKAKFHFPKNREFKL